VPSRHSLPAPSGALPRNPGSRARYKRRIAEPGKALFGPGEEDCFRLIHSTSLRRLSGITQVVAADLTHPHHHRLIHVVEVAQIGRQLANGLLRAHPNAQRYLDPDVVYAACLAHDLGHPCFGHVAEHELDELAVRAGLEDGFEGNAQSFRIVTRLAVYRKGLLGLNLTRATLNAILKYPWLRKPGKADKHHRKWNAYKTEQDVFHWARQRAGVPADAQTLEAQVMDWADDVAYSIHDLEDFCAAGYIPVDRLAKTQTERAIFLDKAAARADRKGRDWNQTRIKNALEFLAEEFFVPLGLVDGSRTKRTALGQMISSLMRRYVKAAKLQHLHSGGPPILEIGDNYRDEVEVLKELTWQYVIDGPPMASHQHGQREIVRKLFEVYSTAVKEDRTEILPLRAREWLTDLRKEQIDWDQEKMRVVVDLIAGLTESQAVAMYQRFTGIRLGESLRSLVV